MQRTCFHNHQNNNNVTRSTEEALNTDSTAIQYSDHVESTSNGSSENECSSADNDDDDGHVNSSVGNKPAPTRKTILKGNVSNKNGNEYVGNMKSRNNNNSTSSGSNSLNNHATRVFSGGGGAAGGNYGNKYTIEHVAFNVDENTYV